MARGCDRPGFEPLQVPTSVQLPWAGIHSTEVERPFSPSEVGARAARGPRCGRTAKLKESGKSEASSSDHPTAVTRIGVCARGKARDLSGGSRLERGKAQVCDVEIRAQNGRWREGKAQVCDVP